jgi:hypothetical protein
VAEAVKANFDAAEIGVMRKTVRLRMLDRMARRAEQRNYIDLACAVLEQVAKECGGLYESRSRGITAPAPSALENPAAAGPAAR